MDKQLQKLIELSKKTGDRLIAFDPSGQYSAYVVMGVDDYEKLAVGMSEVRGLTEDELLDKINRDIAIWKSDKMDDDVLQKLDKYSEAEDEFNNDFIGGESDDWYSVDEIVQKADYINDEEEAKSERSGGWSIPSARKKKAEEIIEEDRYYLEDIED